MKNEAWIAWSETVPPEVIVNPPIGVVEPILPTAMRLFPAASVKDWTPDEAASTVDKLIFPVPPPWRPLIELSDRFPVRVIGLAKVILALFVVMEPPTETAPVPS